MLRLREIKILVLEKDLSQEKIKQFKVNKEKIAFCLAWIEAWDKTKACSKENLNTLGERRREVQKQIDSMTNELSQLYEKQRQFHRERKDPNKIRLRIQELNAIRGRLYDRLEKNLTKAHIYRHLRFINSRLMDYIHEYRKRLIQNKIISEDLKQITINNINLCEIYQ